MIHRRRALMFSLCLVVALVAPQMINSPGALAASPNLVISQVYGGGGNAGAPYTNDFIELFNRGTAPVALNGLSVQYASATGTGNLGATESQLTELPNISLAPGQYFLIQEASGGSNGVALPSPDLVDATPINMSATGGKVALISGTASLGCNGGSAPCDATATARIIDLVGFGNANFFEGTAAPAPSNTTAILRASGGATDTDNNAADFVTGTPTPRNSGGTPTQTPTPTETPTPSCARVDTPIGQVQGNGAATPINGQTATVEGVVVGDYEGASPGLRGFYLQDNGDGDTATSDGIFVFESDNANRVSVGDVVQVTGVVGENQGQTQISSTRDVVACGTTGSVTPVEVDLPLPTDEYLERFEGMLVRFPETLYVTEHFQLGRFGQVVLSSEDRLRQPTNVVLPGDPARALQAANDLNQIIVDDNSQAQNPDPILFARGGQPLSAANTLRGGDTISGLQGVLTYTWGGNSASPNAYRVRPVGALGGGVPNFQPTNPRPTSVPDVGGNLKVASFNVLNYFVTIDPNTNDSDSFTADNVCGPQNDQECRGADNTGNTTPANTIERDRQEAKLIDALLDINADVYGLIELENTAGVEPLARLVDLLNARAGAGTFAYIDTGVIGSDAIKVGIIYKPASVTPVPGATFIDTDPIHNRPPLAQTFESANGGRFTVVVNHFKSKGSCPSDPADPNADQGDGQSCWNPVRVEQANRLVSFINQIVIPGANDPDVLLIGDLNSYAREDPIRALESAGYTNMVAQFSGENAYSYVFDGQWGYLDHALASSSLEDQVTGATDYHINADEPPVLDYNVEFKSPGQVDTLYAADEFRTSDHDPVLIGLDLAVTCNGQVPTIVDNGRGDNDARPGFIRGTNGDDIIAGTAGNDTIDGGNGNDTICGFYGNDVLRGGNGRDTLNGGNGSDQLLGENGDDRLTGGRNADTFAGGRGDDLITDFNATEGDTGSN